MTVCLCASAQSIQNIWGTWGNIDSDIAPWVRNTSRPNTIKAGLDGRHISLWASHGRYYDQDKGFWKWQRPNLFGTTEDLFTQTIVIPYLIPMLENAGCYVFTPRERDWQKQECIVDNDFCYPGGTLMTLNDRKHDVLLTGFKMHDGVYIDGENPFAAGTALSVKTTKRNPTEYRFIPYIKEGGRFAVYISYPRVENAVDDVQYIVRHKGVSTTFSVNQTIGCGTWVYLGTFDFDAVDNGETSDDNCVIVLNQSRHKGNIGIDAIRFGGGMGNIQRFGETSGMPRALEGARYYCQWAGAPYSVYSDKGGENDYGDDINARSLMTNWLGGGSCYMPTVNGLGVPFELALAIHSDAGYHTDGKSIYGSLAIATTNFNEGMLSSGVSRSVSFELASRLLNNINNDMTREFGVWGKRYLWDRNYSETRLPEIPSAIIETLSHQSFPDMKIGQHPLGKFAIARSIYKTILRYISDMHGKKCVVAPLAPTDFRIRIIDRNRIELQWTGINDPKESSAAPTSYNIYTAIDDRDFDNGQNISSTGAVMTLEPGIQYNFRITACNDGGESFSTEILSAYIAPNATDNILVVNGFQRLSAPYIVDNAIQQGFDIAADEGVQRGLYPGWTGKQTSFDIAMMGNDGEQGLGYGDNEMAGKFIAGNDFNYVVEHTRAIASTKRYSVVSCSSTALNNNLVNLNDYRLVDIAFGLQKDDSQLGQYYKTFTSSMRKQISDYTLHGGALLASGSFLGSDMQQREEQEFMANILKVRYGITDSFINSETINGLGIQFPIYRTLNDKHYSATHPQILTPVEGAICAMQYSDGTSAAVGYKDRYSTFTMGFPFECIKDKATQNKIMQGILAYLLDK